MLVIVIILGVIHVALKITLKKQRMSQSPRKPNKLIDFNPAPEQEQPRREPHTQPVQPYKDKFRLFDSWEADLYAKIVAAVPELIVWGQVSLSQILFIKGQDEARQMAEVGRMSVDILVCRRSGSDITAVAAIELNGASHDRPERQRADAIKQRALSEAGIPLITYDIGNMPDANAIRQQLIEAYKERSAYEVRRNERFGRGTGGTR
jgi:hypothetical protein